MDSPIPPHARMMGATVPAGPGLWLEMMDYALFGLATTPGAIEEIAKQHSLLSNGSCAGCTAVAVASWPCPALQFARFARAVQLRLRLADANTQPGDVELEGFRENPFYIPLPTDVVPPVLGIDDLDGPVENP